MKRSRLKTLLDVRRFIANKINEFDSGIIEESKMRTLAYSCNILSGIIRDGELEARVKRLEEATE